MKSTVSWPVLYNVVNPCFIDSHQTTKKLFRIKFSWEAWNNIVKNNTTISRLVEYDITRMIFRDFEIYKRFSCFSFLNKADLSTVIKKFDFHAQVMRFKFIPAQHFCKARKLTHIWAYQITWKSKHKRHKSQQSNRVRILSDLPKRICMAKTTKWRHKMD